MDKKYCPYCMSPVEEGEPCPNCGLTAGSYESQPHHLPPETTLQNGRYLIGRVLGEGGFGITYIGCDTRLGLRVAIKEYYPRDKASRHSEASLTVTCYAGGAVSQYEQGRTKFLTEAQTMARLDRQPNIVSVKDYFEENNTAYIVMEYIDGTTFKELVEQRKGNRIPAWELLHLIEPLFNALDEMHELGLIHRDISPDNLMLEKGTVRLLDFGCARESADGDATMTIMLRHGYAPLEQYQSTSGAQGPWTDVYALAATIYYCITGKTPPRVMDRLLEENQIISPRKLGAELTEAQEKALMKALALHPNHRYKTVREMHTALYEGVDAIPIPPIVETPVIEEPPTGPETPGPEPPGPETGKKEGLFASHKKLFIGVGAGLAALLAVILLVVLLPKGSDTPGTSPSPGEMLDSSGEPIVEPSAVPVGSFDGDWSTARRIDNWEDFLSAVTDGSNTPLTITAEVRANDTSLDESRSLVINNPIRIESGAFLAPLMAEYTSLVYVQQGGTLSPNALTVINGGQLVIEGELNYGSGLLRTVNGGSIVLADSGYMNGPDYLWLDNSSDFVGDLQNAHVNNEPYITDEETRFANAVHVSTFDEFAEAVGYAESIVIDGSFEMAQGCGQIPMPILVSEGVTITGGPNNDVIGFNSLLVNRGTLKCPVYIDHEGAMLMNYGSVERMSGGNKHPNCTILNGGHMDLSGDHYDSAIVNAGTVQVTSGLSLLYTYFDNFGAFTEMDTGWIHMVGDFRSNGTLVISPKAEFVNDGLFYLSDTSVLRVEGRLWNIGVIMNHGGMGHRIFLEGGRIDGDGLVIQWYPEQSDPLPDASYVMYLGDTWYDDPIDVSTYDELLEALNADSVRPIRVTGNNISIGEDIVLKAQMLVIADGAQLNAGIIDVQNGTLMVEEGGTLTADHIRLSQASYMEVKGQVSLTYDGSSFELFDGSRALVYDWGSFDLGDGHFGLHDGSAFANFTGGPSGNGMVIEDGSIYFTRRVDLKDNASINVSAGSTFLCLDNNFNANGLEFFNDGIARITGNMYINGSGSIRNSGQMTILFRAGYIDEGIEFEVNGYFDTDAMQVPDHEVRWHGHIHNTSDSFNLGASDAMFIEGVFTNDGTLMVYGGPTLHINGRMDNNGRAYTDNPERTVEGPWFGNDFEYEAE